MQGWGGEQAALGSYLQQANEQLYSIILFVLLALNSLLKVDSLESGASGLY